MLFTLHYKTPFRVRRHLLVKLLRSLCAGTINFLSNLLLLSSIARVLRLNTRAQTMRLVFVSTIIALVATTLVLAACIFTFVQVMHQSVCVCVCVCVRA